MDDNIFSKKLGPLPVWGWIALAVAGYLVYDFLRHRATSSSTPSGTTVQGYTSARTMGQFVASTGQIMTPTSGNVIGHVGTSAPISGTTWVSHAELALSNLGYNTATVDSALQAYASGSPLSQGQYNIITAAEKLVSGSPFGSPQSPTMPTNSNASIAGTFQKAPTTNVFSATDQLFSPIKSLQQTLTMMAHGVSVFLKTNVSGRAYKVNSVTELKAIEHTGTHSFTQYTTYTQATVPVGNLSSTAYRPMAKK